MFVHLQSQKDHYNIKHTEAEKKKSNRLQMQTIGQGWLLTML